MKLENKILIGGLTLAGAVYFAGIWNQHRLETRVTSLVAVCKATDEMKPTIPSPPPGYTLDAPTEPAAEIQITADEVLGIPSTPPASGPWDDYKGDSLVCDPETLATLHVSNGVQKAIVDAHFASRGAASDAQVIALVIAFLSVIPWLWYFLLRRIVELRNAIGGKLPTE